MGVLLIPLEQQGRSLSFSLRRRRGHRRPCREHDEDGDDGHRRHGLRR
jgi:hypothetical protein